MLVRWLLGRWRSWYFEAMRSDAKVDSDVDTWLSIGFESGASSGDIKPEFVPDSTLLSSLPSIATLGSFGAAFSAARRAKAAEHPGVNAKDSKDEQSIPSGEPAEDWPAQGDAWIRYASKTIEDELPDVPLSAKVLMLAIAIFESKFGVSSDWSYTDPAGRHVHSYNWGAVTRKAGEDWIVHGDTDNGKPITQKFGAHASMTNGFKSFFETWAKERTLHAAVKGDARATARAMKSYQYFGGNEEEYARGIHAVSGRVAKALSVSNPVYLGDLPKTAPSTDRGGLSVFGFVAASALAAVGLVWVSR